MNKIFFVVLLVLIVIFGGCISQEDKNVTSPPAQTTQYFTCSDQNCNTTKLNRMSKNCENIVITTITPETDYELGFTDKSETCKVDITVTHTYSAIFAGKNMFCDVPKNLMEPIVDPMTLLGNNEFLKYCEGTLKELLLHPEWIQN